jgi:hypothetical protein
VVNFSFKITFNLALILSYSTTEAKAYINNNNQDMNITTSMSSETSVVFNFLAFVSKPRIDGLDANIDVLM